MIKKKNDFLSDKENHHYINRKSLILLKHYVTRFDNIKQRKFSKHPVNVQKKIRQAVIRAREIGLFPYSR